MTKGEERAKELGLKSSEHQASRGYATGDLRKWYYAEDIHKLLEIGLEVNVTKTSNTIYCAYSGPRSIYDNSNHSGYLIGIRPIEQESEERKLLRKLIEACHKTDFRPLFFKDLKLSDVYLEAKALLEKQK